MKGSWWSDLPRTPRRFSFCLGTIVVVRFIRRPKTATRNLHPLAKPLCSSYDHASRVTLTPSLKCSIKQKGNHYIQRGLLYTQEIKLSRITFFQFIIESEWKNLEKEIKFSTNNHYYSPANNILQEISLTWTFSDSRLWWRSRMMRKKKNSM